MDFVKLMFQPETIAALMMVVSVAIIFMVFVKYAKEAPDLRSKLTKTQKSLSKLREHVKKTKESVAALKKEVKPLKQIERKLEEYEYEVKMILDSALEKEAAAENKKQIKQHKH